MDTVKVTRVAFIENYEELAAAGVFPRMRHRQRPYFVLMRIAGGLTIDLVARSAGPDAAVAFRKVARERVSALDHEIRNDTVKLDSVVVALVGELFEVGDCIRRFPVVQLRGHGATVGFDRCVSGHLLFQGRNVKLHRLISLSSAVAD